MQPGIVAGMATSIVICFALPVVSFIALQKKKLHIARAFLFGALAFFVSQVLLRIPLLQILGQLPAYQGFSKNTVPFGLFLGLTAGLFEEVARYLMCRMALKRNRRYADALAFGFGHGGIEAVLLSGLSLVSSLVLYVALSNGTLTQLVGPENARLIEAQFSGLTPGLSLLGGLERILAVGMHLFFSVLVFAGFRKGKPVLYLLYAILAHAAVDALVVILPKFLPMSAYALEGILLVISLACVLYTVYAKKFFPPEEPLPAQTESGGYESAQERADQS